MYIYVCTYVYSPLGEAHFVCSLWRLCQHREQYFRYVPRYFQRLFLRFSLPFILTYLPLIHTYTWTYSITPARDPKQTRNRECMAGTRISREIGGNAWRGRVFRENYVGMNGGGRFFLEKFVGMHGWGAYFSRTSWECGGAYFSRNTRPRQTV